MPLPTRLLTRVTRRGKLRVTADRLLGGLLGLSVVAGPGCHAAPNPVSYLGERHADYYKGVAETIDHPAIRTVSAETVTFTEPPHTIRDRRKAEIWDLPLHEAVRLALANNEVLRTNGTFLGGAQVLNGPDQAATVYDPAIQETGVLLGNRGVEAALADFDAQFITNVTWSRNDSLSNSPFAGDGGPDLGGPITLGNSIASAGNFNAGLSKVFAHGGQIQLNHNVNRSFSNSPFQAFTSSYSGSASIAYRQPLLAGAGTEFTRIAGPVTGNFTGLGPQAGGIFGGGAGGGTVSAGGVNLTGVSQGVVIARINNDISLADFERNVRDLLRDVENVYWDLYLAYRNYDTAVTQRNASLETWRISKIRRDLEADILPADEAQARDQYFASQAQADSARSTIFETETRLRRLLNLPVSDGRVIRPVDEPTTAEVIPDWYACLSEALTHRVELRRQKWNIKSLQLQLRAARSLLKPRLDLVSGYQVNGFGDDLLNYDDPPGGNFYETLLAGDQTGWQLGVQFSVPLGQRAAHAQERNIEFRLAKAQRVLGVAEQEISQELANAFQVLARARANVQSQFSRRAAAIENVALLEPLLEEGQITLDELLRAQARRADAEGAFFSAVVSYNQALVNLQYRKGALLAYDNVSLLEGAWKPAAHYDAARRAEERAHARPAPHRHFEPEAFASGHSVGPPAFATAAAATEAGGQPGVLFEDLGEIHPVLPTDAGAEDDVTAAGAAESGGPAASGESRGADQDGPETSEEDGAYSPGPEPLLPPAVFREGSSRGGANQDAHSLASDEQQAIEFADWSRLDGHAGVGGHSPLFR